MSIFSTDRIPVLSSAISAVACFNWTLTFNSCAQQPVSSTTAALAARFRPGDAKFAKRTFDTIGVANYSPWRHHANTTHTPATVVSAQPSVVEGRRAFGTTTTYLRTLQRICSGLAVSLGLPNHYASMATCSRQSPPLRKRRPPLLMLPL